MTCPACRSDNLEGTETCFHCGQPLAGTGALRSIKRGTVLAGRYEILSPLGKGGMGMVYKAHDRALEEIVALKVLRAEIATSPDLVRRFRSEIKLARKVSHRNVCRIHEYGVDGELSFISMELVDGTDLKRILRERGALPEAEALQVAIHVCEGLVAIHEVGIVHRDLKTANLMRDSAGIVKLMDFGIAKQTGAAAEGLTGATATGQIIGTPEYMSPEQARGEKLDARSDIYALGIVIFELFTGSVPFRGDTPIATILKHIRDPPPLDGPSVAALPAPVVAVLRRALAKEPAERFASVREMTDALRAGSTVAPVRASAPAVPPPSRAAAVPRPRPEPLTSATPVPTSVPTAVPTVPRQAIPETRRVGAPRARAASQPASQPGPSHGGFTPAQLWLIGGAVVAVAVVAASVVGVLLLQLSRRTPPSTAERPSPSPSESVVALARATATPSPSQSLPDPSPLLVAPTPKPAREPASPRPSPRIEPAASPAPRPSSVTLAALPQPTAPPPSPPPQVVATPAPTPLATPRESAPTPAPTKAAPAEAPAAAAAPRRPEGRGLLAIEVKPEAEIVIDGTVVGRMKNYTAPLDAGLHTVVFRHPKYEPLQRKVEIVPQEKARLVVDLKDEGLPAKK